MRSGIETWKDDASDGAGEAEALGTSGGTDRPDVDADAVETADSETTDDAETEEHLR
jgi:hypothetical protein